MPSSSKPTRPTRSRSNSDLPCFRVVEGTLWSGQTLHKLYQEAYTPWEWQPKLKAAADELGMHCFSSPFDPTAVDFLEAMEVPAYKVASFELVDLPLIEKMARTGKPIIMSIGTATVGEIDDAVRAARQGGGRRVACLAEVYQRLPGPAGGDEPADDSAPRGDVRRAGRPLGPFDGDRGAGGGRGSGGLDHREAPDDRPQRRRARQRVSLEPREFRAMVDEIRVAEQALGGVRYEVTEREAVARAYRRSLFVVKDVRQGETFTAENVRSIRPADGLPPKYLGKCWGGRPRATSWPDRPLPGR